MAKIEAYKSYYWADNLAEIKYKPAGDGFPACWVSADMTHPQLYTQEEMQEMLDGGVITEGFGATFTPEPVVKPVKIEVQKPDDYSDMDQFIDKPVYIKMKEGVEILTKVVELIKEEKDMIIIDVVIYDKDGTHCGEAGVIDMDEIELIREMSPTEEAQWVQDYTDAVSDEEAEYLARVVEKINEKTSAPAAKKKSQSEDKKKAKKIAKPKAEYSVDLINSDISPDQIAEKMKIAMAKEDRPALTVLFHGQPGTSKTQTAKYITSKLEMPLATYNLGEIMSKWVGETEKKINEIFEEAKKEGNAILIDEIEGLTQDRSGAEKSWQMTHVNAFLQAVDEFDGVLFCTTNFTDNMDKAFLRRFLLKAEFKNMTSEQATKAFKQFFPKLRNRAALEDDFYAPADFALVKNGFLFMNDEDITVKYVKEQLEKEAKSRRITKKNQWSINMDENARMGFSLQNNKKGKK